VCASVCVFLVKKIYPLEHKWVLIFLATNTCRSLGTTGGFTIVNRVRVLKKHLFYTRVDFYQLKGEK
jgi:hypothetical protein